MTIQLEKNDTVRLAIGATRRENARVKRWVDNGCVCLSFSGNIALRPGTKVQLEIPNTNPRAFYYMQAVECLEKEKTELYLSRNTNSQFDQRRRSWRVPYAAQTVIQKKGGQHLADAEFTNISMEAAYLLTTESVSVGEEVSLRLVLPEYPEHTVTARVMRLSDTALDRDVNGKERYGMLVCFEKLQRLAKRHLTYFMWQQIRKTHLRHLQLVFAGTARKPRKAPEAPAKIVAEVDKRAQPLD